MSQSEHEQAVQAALDTVNGLDDLFGALGAPDDDTRGVYAAYYLAFAALIDSLDNHTQTRAILKRLDDTVRALVERELKRALRLGEYQAREEIQIYDLNLARERAAAGLLLLVAALDAIRAELESQIAKVNALALNGIADPDLVLGDGGRVGILRPSAVVGETTQWLTTLTHRARNEMLMNADGEFFKQAVAVVDARTTDCCLQVHGQVVALDADFDLKGTPRFADQLPYPPFHWWCRTGVVLVRAEDIDDSVTRRMLVEANQEVRARNTRGEPVVAVA